MNSDRIVRKVKLSSYSEGDVREEEKSRYSCWFYETMKMSYCMVSIDYCTCTVYTLLLTLMLFS